ncbi:MAG: hypothetical protein JHC84_15370 [Solirubrobacteraceae bacterium]|nr:hypothetical protein [Solirubrobacteraceae bacterium]
MARPRVARVRVVRVVGPATPLRAGMVLPPRGLNTLVGCQSPVVRGRGGTFGDQLIMSSFVVSCVT